MGASRKPLTVMRQEQLDKLNNLNSKINGAKDNIVKCQELLSIMSMQKFHLNGIFIEYNYEPHTTRLYTQIPEDLLYKLIEQTLADSKKQLPILQKEFEKLDIIIND